jgi:hypothetical protein
LQGFPISGPTVSSPITDALSALRTDLDLKRRVETGAVAVTTRDGRQVVAISELIRVGWLDSHGERWLLPETYGLPLSVPLDPEQMLTKRDVSELLGATSHTVSSWVERRHVQSIVVGGWPGPGNPKRRLIPVPSSSVSGC